MDDRFNIRRYMDYLNPDSQIREELVNRTNPYSTSPFINTAPKPETSFTDLQNMTSMPIDPFEDYQGPSTLASLNQGLQIAQTAPKLLGMKVGDKTLGQALGLKSGVGTTLGNPFTRNVSAGTFEPAVAGSEMTALQAGASNYFQNLKSGSVSAGLPTYLVGRAIRSAFDDDDPTSFSAGEMLGAGVSGAGAGSALAPILGISGPLGIGLGVAISLLGGRRKRNKARKLQQEYQQALKDREKEIREQYNESIREARKESEGQARAANYMRNATAFSNPYGLGNMEDGGKMPEYFFGGLFNAIQSVFSGAADATTGVIDSVSDLATSALDITADVTQAAAQPVLDAGNVVGDTVIEPVVDTVVQPALDVAFEGLEAGGEVLQMGIESGIDLAQQGINFAGGMAQAGMETVGKVAFPIIEAVGEPIANVVQGIGSGLFDMIQGDDDESQINLPPMQNPNIQTAETVQAPNIVTVNPYTNKPVTKALDFSMASGSAGFVRPENVEQNNIYTQTQESV